MFLDYRGHSFVLPLLRLQTCKFMRHPSFALLFKKFSCVLHFSFCRSITSFTIDSPLPIGNKITMQMLSRSLWITAEMIFSLLHISFSSVFPLQCLDLHFFSLSLAYRLPSCTVAPTILTAFFRIALAPVSSFRHHPFRRWFGHFRFQKDITFVRSALIFLFECR